ncbi:hypothetical protein CTAYLR_001726 [Chrysophaeum taylorii]|uniref:S-adenosyl-L-homocysteine hydrolase NAD binding domain-containing protein n=1 Tax=Chrysophaeum taylorii TaxID=2483200 RepID=A0AAD7U6E6_9STRA|nr:hypothetical protein CTAYLR_001726 [Chrysophaeum taylorii]
MRPSSLLKRVAERVAYPLDPRHRYLILSHLFDDTRRMLEALEPFVAYDAIVGIPYSSNRPGVLETWQARFGADVVHVEPTIEDTEDRLLVELDKSLDNCERFDQKLIVQECGGFVVPLLHAHFGDRLHLVKGVVEITKQGVWRAESLDQLKFPVLHCAASDVKRLEAKRCGETVARCLDGLYRDLGLAAAGRQATVFGAGWIGLGVAAALKRLDVIPAIVDIDPLKVMEARLDGFVASTYIDPHWISRSDLVVGATGRRSVTPQVIDLLPDGALVASASSRQLEIDVDYLQDTAVDSAPITPAIDAFHLPLNERQIYLVNRGFPANFVPGSQSVPDEIVEPVLAELIVLMRNLASTPESVAGVRGITREEEQNCADLWLELRDQPTLAASRAASHAEQHLPAEIAKKAVAMGPPSMMTWTRTLPRVAAARAHLSTAPSNAVPARVGEGLRHSPFKSDDAPRRQVDEDDQEQQQQQQQQQQPPVTHSPYLVQRLVGQKPNLYGVAKFDVVSEEIRKISATLNRPARILDLGCSTAISRLYLEANNVQFEYCGIDYEAAFEPDIVMDVRELDEKSELLPWQPDVILLLDVLEHLTGKERDIQRVMAACEAVIPDHGAILAVVPQLYRMDRLKLDHLHYPEHAVRFTLDEWRDILVDGGTNIGDVRGIGYISVLPYVPMLSPWYRDDNGHGALFRYLRGTAFEWEPLKPAEIAITRALGRIWTGWCNSTLLVCRKNGVA